MTIIATRLAGPVLLTNSAMTLFTAPTNSIVFVSAASFDNTDTANHTIKVYVVPAGGTTGAANQVISNQSLSIGQSYQAPELRGLVLNPGDTIQALADTAALVNCIISGFIMGSSGN